MRVLLTMSENNIMHNVIPTLYAGYITSTHILVMESRSVDPGSIQGSHRPISFMRIKYTSQNSSERPSVKLVKLSINNDIVGLVHKHHIINEISNKHVQRTCLMYHAACKVEFQPFNRSYSQLTFFNFL